MSGVTFAQAVGGDGSTVTDDSDPTTGLGQGGHRTRFVPALAQVVAVAAFVVMQAAAAANAAASAANAPGTSATTTTSISIGTGSKSFTLTQTGKAFSFGQTVVVASAADATKNIVGTVTVFNSSNGAMTVNATASSGSGSFSDGVVALSAVGGVLPTRTISASGLATGGGDLSADRTITVPAASTADTQALSSSSAALTPGGVGAAVAEVPLQDGATITTVGDGSLDMSKFINGVVTLAGNRTLPNPINPTPGKSGRIRFIQDGSGNRTLGVGSYWKRQGGGTPLSASPGAIDFLIYDVITTSYILYDIVRNPS